MQAKTTKGGGLFGMFQQDTVFADEADEEAGAPPSEEKVARAVTIRGKGPPPGRQPVKELIPRKAAQVRALPPGCPRVLLKRQALADGVCGAALRTARMKGCN